MTPAYLVGERVLLEVVDLAELHAALGADEGPHVLVLEGVVLQLAAVVEGLVALGTRVQRGPLVRGQVALELGESGEVQATFHTHVAAAALVLPLVGLQLAGVGKATATKAAAIGLDIRVQQHVALEVASLGEGLVAHLALVGPCALVGEQVGLQVAGLLEEFAAVWAGVRLDAIVPQDVGHQVVLGGIGLLAQAALPALLYQVGIVNLDIDVQAVHVHLLAVLAGDLRLEVQGLLPGKACPTLALLWGRGRQLVLHATQGRQARWETAAAGKGFCPVQDSLGWAGEPFLIGPQGVLLLRGPSRWLRPPAEGAEACHPAGATLSGWLRTRLLQVAALPLLFRATSGRFGAPLLLLLHLAPLVLHLRH